MNKINKTQSVDKTNINWLIAIYSNFWRNPLFIMFCED